MVSARRIGPDREMPAIGRHGGVGLPESAGGQPRRVPWDRDAAVECLGERDLSVYTGGSSLSSRWRGGVRVLFVARGRTAIGSKRREDVPGRGRRAATII